MIDCRRIVDSFTPLMRYIIGNWIRQQHNKNKIVLYIYKDKVFTWVPATATTYP